MESSSGGRGRSRGAEGRLVSQLGVCGKDDRNDVS